MESEGSISSSSLVKCCDCACGCSLMNRSYPGPWVRTVKRKLDEFEDENKFSILDFPFTQIARVGVENECEALRHIIRTQQETIQQLSLELEEERNASSSAANETMSMILKLQKEKSEIQMEARQFKRFAEEKMAHDQDELSAMDELLDKREQSIQSLYSEIQVYKQRLMSYGVAESELDDSFIEFDSQCDHSIHDCPPLKCSLNEKRVGLASDNGIDDIGECDMQKMENGKEEEQLLAKVEYSTKCGDEMDDRIYNKYLINQECTDDGSVKLKPLVGDYHDDLITPKDCLNKTEVGDSDIKKLYLRLQALEADRESMTQAIVSLRTEKAHLILLKEIAQHLCKDMSAVKRVPVKKASLFSTFSIVSMLKWIISLIFWRRKVQYTRYTFGWHSYAGLFMFLDKALNLRQWTCHSITKA